MRPRAPRVGDKCGRQVGDKFTSMPERLEWETSVGDKWKTSVKSCGPEHPERNASPETKTKSCGPGMQPFERSKNPIQVNLFGEQCSHGYFPKNGMVLSKTFENQSQTKTVLVKSICGAMRRGHPDNSPKIRWALRCMIYPDNPTLRRLRWSWKNVAIMMPKHFGKTTPSSDLGRPNRLP